MRVIFQIDRETKNTVRYEEQPTQGEPKAIGTLYIQKYAIQRLTPDGKVPNQISVEVKAS